MNVESVAWIAQLKGILSLLFALVSVYFFLSSEKREGWWRIALAIGEFSLSTLAKGMVITLPVVLLAIAWWQRGTNRCGGTSWRGSVSADRRGYGRHRDWTQRLSGAEAAVGDESFFSRMAIAAAQSGFISASWSGRSTCA